MDILTIMSDERPGIFSITLKFRQIYASLVEHALDIDRAKDMTVNKFRRNCFCGLRVEWVLGEWDALEGVYTDFALGGDSGSLLLRMVRDPEGILESEAIVMRTEGAGLMYGIVREEKYKSFVALYMNIDEVFREIKEGTGLDVDFAVPDVEGEDWPYVVMGRGRSTYELH
jgi:hypothetical protein